MSPGIICGLVLNLCPPVAAKVLGVKSRTEAVHVALREIVALKRFKDLMRRNAGKHKFEGQDEGCAAGRSAPSVVPGPE